MILTLIRDPVQQQPYCTMGTLSIKGTEFQTVERPWVPHPGALCGEQGKSCIGKGLYTLEQRHTEAKGDHWILSAPELGVFRYEANIPSGIYGRSLILIHAANWAHELLGCIAPGKGRAVMDSELGVTSSRTAMDGMRILLATESSLQLEVK